MNKQPRELNRKEVRDNFLNYCQQMTNYWENLSDKTLHERMEGLVFSILVGIDGESSNLPPFILAPLPQPEDQPYMESQGENWYPQNTEEDINCDIGGNLHEYFVKMEAAK